MDIKNYVEKECEKFSNISKKLLTDLYMKGYHKGRHYEREKLLSSGYLIINPDKKDKLMKACEDPCKHCSYYTDEFKIGCSMLNPQNCQDKQNQLLAIEIRKYFK